MYTLKLSYRGFEPLVIMSPFGDWIHPDIHYQLRDQETIYEELEETYYTNMVKVDLYNTNLQHISVICKVDYEDINTMFILDLESKQYNEEAIRELTEYLFVNLIEDVWVTSEGQFCFTEYGQTLSNFFPKMKVEKYSVTPDLALVDELDGNWRYDT